jgi:hypothetical protein
MVGGHGCPPDFAHHQFQIVPHHKATYLFTIQTDYEELTQLSPDSSGKV